MKKKKLTTLTLRKYKISNLSALQSTVGGTASLETEGVPGSENSLFTLCEDCFTKDIFVCTSVNFERCTDDTNTGTSQLPPPTEYESCLCNVPGF